MSAATTLHKALIQLDYGRYDQAVNNLRKAIEEASNEGDELTKYGAMCCLGDVLFEGGDVANARPLLEEVASLQRDDDVLVSEQRRARELLAQM